MRIGECTVDKWAWFHTEFQFILNACETQIWAQIDSNSATLWISSSASEFQFSATPSCGIKFISGGYLISQCLQLLRDRSLQKPCIHPCLLISSLRLSKMQSHVTPLLVPLRMIWVQFKDGQSQVEDHLHSIAALYTDHHYNTCKSITKTHANLQLLVEHYKINFPEIFRS